MNVIISLSSFVIKLIVPIVVSTWYGIIGSIDAINPQYPISLYYHSTRIKKNFNTFIYWNLFVLICNTLIYIVPQNNVWFSRIIYAFWFMPIWILSDYINKIAQIDMMHILLKQKRNLKKKKGSYGESTITNKVTDIIYEGVFFMSMHIILSISKGFWSKIIYLTGYSLICSYSLMSFRLNYEHIPLKKKIKLFEKYWIYFLFYGLPYALLYISFPAPISYPFFHLLSSLTLPNTINSAPKNNSKWVFPFEIFYIPQLLANRIAIIILYLTDYKK
jgi:hypothetical protein